MAKGNEAKPDKGKGKATDVSKKKDGDAPKQKGSKKDGKGEKKEGLYLLK